MGDAGAVRARGRFRLLPAGGTLYAAGPFRDWTSFCRLCESKSISVILGGPYNSGVLASDLGPDTTYFYQRTPPEVLEAAKRIKGVCDRHGVPLKAAALQFGLAHPAVAATIPGPRSPQEVEENLAMASFEIPADLWAELKAEGMIPANAPTG